MKIALSEPSIYLQLQFNEQIAKLKLTDDLIMGYNGIVDGLTISKIENEIEEKLNILHIPKAEIKKIFFTCVELIQNQFLYGKTDEKNKKNCYFLVSLGNKSIKLTGANLIQSTQENYIKEKISIVNSFKNQVDLKAYYLNQLANNEFGEKGGAGLGFIALALKSKNLLQTEFQKIDDNYSVFILNINFDISINPKTNCPLFDGFNI